MRRRAFTIVELLVAIGLLAVVILAASKILGTTTQVSGLGEANSNVTQEAEAVEKQLRQDLARLDLDGYLVVRCVGVRNDVNRLFPQSNPSAPLLNPVLDPNAILRCDQVVFFMKGAEDTQLFVGGNADIAQTGKVAPRSSSSRVIYGHGVQVPELTPQSEVVGNRFDPVGFDFGPLVPWAWDEPGSGRLETAGSQSGSGPTVNGAQPEARQWILARQSILLADDGDNLPTRHQGFPSLSSLVATAAGGLTPDGSIPTGNLVPAGGLDASRTDVCSQSIADVRRVVERFGTGERRPWGGTEPWGFGTGAIGTRSRIINATFGAPAATLGLGAYPRAERRAPSMHQLDVMLTSPTILRNCSDFIVDWTWGDRTGQVLNPDGSVAVLAKPLAAANGPSPILWGVRQLGYERDNPSAVVVRPLYSDGTVSLPYLPDWFTNGVPSAWFGFPDYGIGDTPGSKRIPNVPREVVSVQWPQTWFWRNGDTPYRMVMCQVGAPVHYEPIDGSLPSRIEGPPVNAGGAAASNGPWTRPYGAGVPVYVYTAVFGFNNEHPTETVTVTDNAGFTSMHTVLRDDYTPWPSALRFTMRIHDAGGKLVEGRLYQFVIDLPQRGLRAPSAQANGQGVLR
jgi:type II secretory pathway pseudopilin PulG